MKRKVAWLLSAALIFGAFSGLPAAAAGSFNTNLENLRGLQGTWTETGDGLRAVGNGDCFAMSDTVAQDFIYETDVTINTQGAASLVFRSNERGSQAYVANVDLNRGDARLFKFPATGVFEFGSYKLPDRSKKDYSLRIEAVGRDIRFYVNGVLAVKTSDDSYTSGRLGLLIWSSDSVFKNVRYTKLDAADLPKLTGLEAADDPTALYFDESLSDFHVKLPYTKDSISLKPTAADNTSIKMSAYYGQNCVLDEQEIKNGENSAGIPLSVGVTTVNLVLEKSGIKLHKTVTVRRESPSLGDLNSDGRFTKEDLDILSDIINNVKTPDKFEKVLADLNGDNNIDTEDKTMLEQKISDDAKITKRLKYEDIVGKMTDLRSLADPVEKGERSAESTSYDRRSRYDEATGKYIDWGANDDWGTSFETTADGGKILADIKGAGAIVRIWSAEPKTGHVKIFIDGASEPVIDMPFVNYFGGSFPFNLSSMLYESGRGMNCYVPITYSSSCKVVAYDDWGRYFHIGYITYPDNVSVEPFSLPLSAEGQRALMNTNKRLEDNVGTAVDEYSDKTTEQKTVTVPAGGKVELLNTKASGAVVGITAKLNGLEKEGDDWDALAALAVSAKWDGEEASSVFTTLGGFFASICGVNEYSGLPLGVKSDKTMYSDWYMPYSDGALITLQNDGDRDYSITYSISTVSLDKSKTDGLLRFHAKWTRLKDPDKSSDRWPDSEFLNVKGTSGRFVGTSLHVYKQIGLGDPDYNPDWWWGEGDEKFFVDSEKFPSWFGTGSEDYFGYAWGSWKTFGKPYNSQPFTNGGMYGVGNRLNNRFHIIDSVPFNDSFSANLEKYHRDGYANMVLTNYWYQEKGTTDNYKEVSYKERTEYYENPYPDAAVYYEAEQMKIIECSESQKAEIQDMSVFGNTWSNATQLMLKSTGIGSYLKLYINVPETADYDLKAAFTKAGDYGIAQHYVDGFKVGNTIDLYNNGVIRSDETNIGSVRLTKGLHELEVRIEGKNPVSNGYFYGLDYVKLVKTEDKIRIACVGDSITYGELCTYGKQSTDSYPAQLQSILGDGYVVGNFGVNGATMMNQTRNQGTPYIYKPEYEQSLKFKPDIVIIKLGTNDASNDDTNNGNPDLIDSYYKQCALDMVKTYQSLEDAPTVYIATSATCYFNTAQPSVIENKIVPLQKEVAAETGCTVIDVHEATKQCSALFPDSLHPNAQGYGVIASVVGAGVITGKPTTASQIKFAKAYAKASQLVGKTGYTDESYAEFKSTFDELKQTFAKLNDITEDQLSAAADKLNAALGSLVTVRSKTISKIADVAGINCDYGTAFDKLNLPATVTATLADKTTVECAVEWDASGYDPTKSGAQTITGELTTVSPVTNPKKLLARVVVTVGEKPPVKDTNTGGGTVQKPKPKPAKVKKLAVKVKNGKATVSFKKVAGVKKYTVRLYSGKKLIKSATAGQRAKITLNKRLKKGRYTVKVQYTKNKVKSGWAQKTFRVKK